MASIMPFLACVCRLVKKLTVNGSIGKIHGNRSAANPPMKPSRKMVQRLNDWLLLVAGFTEATAGLISLAGAMDLLTSAVGISVLMGVNWMSAVLILSVCEEGLA